MDKKWTIGWIKKMDGQNHGQKNRWIVRMKDNTYENKIDGWLDG